jgi:hypothetical protein
VRVGSFSTAGGITSSILQAGSDTLGTDGTKSTTFPVAFPSGVTPKVFVSSRDANNSGVVLDITAVSNTGFTVKARKVTGMGTGSAGDHFHSVGVSGTTGTPSATTDAMTSITRATCASGHTNCQVTEVGYSTVAGGSHTHGCSWTNYTGTTGAHSHSVDAPAIGSISFNWLAVNL